MQCLKNLVWLVVVIGGCCFIWTSTLWAVSEEEDMKRLVQGNTAFALELYARLSEDEGNLFFSPYSISTALAMTYAGARGNTEQQMAEALLFPLEQETLHPAFAGLSEHFQQIQNTGDVALSIANALWIQKDFELLEQFLTCMKKYYDAGVFQVNFQEAYEEVRLEINAWVEEKTREKIRDLLPPGVLNGLTRLVLTNAIYFKGKWTIEFEEDFTNEESFWVTPEQEITTPLMYQKNTFKYGEDETLQILQMPYKGEDLSMLIVLPKEKDGLTQLEANFTLEQLTNWLSQISFREVEVYLPKFTFTSQFNLSGILKEMGMTDAFSGHADFSGMEPEEQLSISEVIHKAFIEVNEEGTEAAAATAVVVGVTSVAEPQTVPIFRADHPFLFLIRDEQTESLLFLGRVINPT